MNICWRLRCVELVAANPEQLQRSCKLVCLTPLQQICLPFNLVIFNGHWLRQHTTGGHSSGCTRPPLETLHLFELLINVISGRSCSRAGDTQLMEEVLKLLPLWVITESNLHKHTLIFTFTVIYAFLCYHSSSIKHQETCVDIRCSSSLQNLPENLHVFTFSSVSKSAGDAYQYTHEHTANRKR